MKEAGGNTFIFQWESESIQDEPDPTKAATRIAESVVEAGMAAGISLNPGTDVKEIFSLLKSGLISVVDVLAVEPGFGGQKFQDVAVSKINSLVKFRQNSDLNLDFAIMVDGGINKGTATKVTSADILVAGTFLFNHPSSLSHGVNELKQPSIDKLS
jgi:ribulose-phosphate 3-epimerase